MNHIVLAEEAGPSGHSFFLFALHGCRQKIVLFHSNGDLTVDIKPLPTVVRPQQQLISVNWIVAGLVALFLVGAGLLLLHSGDDKPIVQSQTTTQAQREACLFLAHLRMLSIVMLLLLLRVPCVTSARQV